jgi:hypothetical protein
LVLHIKGRTQTEDVWEKRIGENIWTKDSDRSGEKEIVHNEELHNVYSLASIMVSKSRRMRGVEHITRKGGMSNAHNILVRKLKGREDFGNAGIHGTMILVRI